MKKTINRIIAVSTVVCAFMIAPGLMGVVFAAGESGFDKADQGQTVLTLELARETAMKNSPTIASAVERITQAREGIAQAEAGYYPTVSVSAGWDYNEATDNTAAGYDETRFSNRISVTQTLFDGFYRRWSVMSAEYGEKMSLAAAQDARRLLAWSVAQAWLNVQLARENVTIAQSDMEFNRKQEAEAVIKKDAGTGSYSDVLNFKTKVNSARSALLAAGQDLNESVFGLAALLGYEDAILPREMVIGSLEIPEERLKTVSTIDPCEEVSSFLLERPDILQAFLAVENADAGVHMARADYYPTIALTASYGTSAGDTLDDTGSMGSSLGVSVSFDLFSEGVKKSKVREALSYKKEMEKELENAKIAAAADIRSAAMNIATAQKQLFLQQENTRLMEETRDLVQKEYAAGQASLVRLNEAQNSLVTSQGELATSRVALILAIEQYDYYTARTN